MKLHSQQGLERRNITKNILLITRIIFKKSGKGLRRLSTFKSKNFDSPTCLQDGDINITDPIAISNSFNDYFSTIADKILEKRKYNGAKSFRDFLANRMTGHIVFSECDENEVANIIS